MVGSREKRKGRSARQIIMKSEQQQPSFGANLVISLSLTVAEGAERAQLPDKLLTRGKDMLWKFGVRFHCQ